MPNKNPEAYRAYMKIYMKRRYHQRMREFRKRFGGKCQRCGSKKKLEFDHIDRRTKKSRKYVIGNLWNCPMRVIEAELKKCQLLCSKCHQNKGRQAGDIPPAAQHGNHRRYQYGCRCELCRERHNAYSRIYKRKRRAEKSGRLAQPGLERSALNR